MQHFLNSNLRNDTGHDIEVLIEKKSHQIAADDVEHIPISEFHFIIRFKKSQKKNSAADKVEVKAKFSENDDFLPIIDLENNRKVS